MIQRARMMFLVAAALAATTLPAHAQNATFGLTDIEAMLSTVFPVRALLVLGHRPAWTSDHAAADGRLQRHARHRVLAQQQQARLVRHQDHPERRDARGRAALHVRARGFQPYLGAGWGVHFQASKVTAPTLGLDESDTVTRGGLAVLGGLSMPITARLANVLQLKFHYLPRDSQTKLNYGLSWKF